MLLDFYKSLSKILRGQKLFALKMLNYTILKFFRVTFLHI